MSERQELNDQLPRASRPSLRWVAAISALAAGITGVVVGFVLSTSRERVEVPVPAAAPSTLSTLLSGASGDLLLATLEGGESGKAVVERDPSVHIILTFQTEDGRYCRAFRSRAAGTAAEGVACRYGVHWQVVGWDGTVDPDEGFRAAGSSELLDDVMDRLGGGAALEPAEERDLIEQHWIAPQR